MIRQLVYLRGDLLGIAGFTLISFEHYITGIFFIVMGCTVSSNVDKYLAEAKNDTSRGKN